MAVADKLTALVNQANTLNTLVAALKADSLTADQLQAVCNAGRASQAAVWSLAKAANVVLTVPAKS